MLGPQIVFCFDIQNNLCTQLTCSEYVLLGSIQPQGTKTVWIIIIYEDFLMWWKLAFLICLFFFYIILKVLSIYIFIFRPLWNFWYDAPSGNCQNENDPQVKWNWTGLSSWRGGLACPTLDPIWLKSLRASAHTQLSSFSEIAEGTSKRSWTGLSSRCGGLGCPTLDPIWLKYLLRCVLLSKLKTTAYFFRMIIAFVDTDFEIALPILLKTWHAIIKRIILNR